MDENWIPINNLCFFNKYSRVKTCIQKWQNKLWWMELHPLGFVYCAWQGNNPILAWELPH
jgi:hypothetical protein